MQLLGRSLVYVCNCNGIREREVRAAAEAGALQPRDVFQRHACKAQCARCVCEMRQIIRDVQEDVRLAAE